MSTLPFLLSVADELDNINSQSYMDDFGLGFYPHRTAFHRTPTIQLSLPASTDWTSAIDSRHSQTHSRYRSNRYYSSVDTTQNYLQSAFEEEDNEGGNGGGRADADDDDDNAGARRGRDERRNDVVVDARRRSTASNAAAAAAAAVAAAADADANHLGASTSTAAAAVATTTTALNSNTNDNNGSRANMSGGGMKVRSVSGGTTRSGLDVDDDEHIDTTVRMYNLSKKCCKNYYRHAIETGPGAKGIKCTADSNKSSSEESLQKVSSPIEFLTCFLVKKSRTPKSVSSSACSGGSAKKS